MTSARFCPFFARLSVSSGNQCMTRASKSRVKKPQPLYPLSVRVSTRSGQTPHEFRSCLYDLHCATSDLADSTQPCNFDVQERSPTCSANPEVAKGKYIVVIKSWISLWRAGLQYQQTKIRDQRVVYLPPWVSNNGSGVQRGLCCL